MTHSALYLGEVVHLRQRPVHHRLAYRVFMGLFDLDELPALASRTRLFGYNRHALVSLFDKDHGDGSAAPLRPQVEAALAAAGIAIPAGAIRLLCMPRILGYVFNPLSVYFCHDPDGELRAIVHEVNNTFGGRHFYALPAEGDDSGRIVQQCDKQFPVSPFLPADLHYRFMIDSPRQRASVTIGVEDDEGPVLYAWFTGERRPFTTRTLLRAWLSHPALTFKVIGAIHWEALLIWLKLRRSARKPERVEAS